MTVGRLIRVLLWGVMTRRFRLGDVVTRPFGSTAFFVEVRYLDPMTKGEIPDEVPFETAANHQMFRTDPTLRQVRTVQLD